MTVNVSILAKPRFERLRKFVGKHDRALSVFGAGLVLLTFVVREGKREVIKELIGSIESSRNVFLTREDIRSQSLDVRKMEKTLSQVNERLVTQSRRLPDTWEQFFWEDSIHEWREESLFLRATLDTLPSVAEKLPDSKKSADCLSALTEQLKNHDIEAARLEGYFLKSPTAHGNSHVEFSEFRSQTEKIRNDIRAIEDKVMKDANETLRHKRDQYENYTTIAYGTFGLGWLLGLVGKVFGVKALEGPGGGIGDTHT